MSPDRYPTAFQSWGPEEEGAISRVLQSGRFTMGDEVAALERELAEYHGMRHAIAVNSGSSANLVAVAALANTGRIRRDDRAIVPALAWPTLFAPLVQHGLRLALADADRTWNMSPAHVVSRYDAALIVLCPILGNPAHLATLAESMDPSATVMVDACESCGARENGRLAATFGLVNTVSFFWSHQISAIEGGAVLTNDDDIALMCRMLRNHGWTRGTSLQQGGFAGEYDFRVFGYNVRAVELHAAIAREQLRKVNIHGKERNLNLLYWYEATEGLPINHPDIAPGASVNPFGFAFTVKDAVTRARLAAQLREAGIDCRPPVGGSFKRHGYAAQANATGDTPFADFVHDCGLFLGCAPFPMTSLIDRAADVMRRVLT